MVKSGITKDELIDWGGSEVFNQALAICNSGDVSDVTYDDDTLVIAGKITNPDGSATASVQRKISTLTASPLSKSTTIAAIIYLET